MIKKTFAVFFLFLFCYSFLAVPYAEANLWAERKAAAQKMREDAQPLREPQETLLAQLPTIHQGVLPRIPQSYGEQPSVLDSLPLAAASHIPITSLKLPLAYSNFKSAHFPIGWKPSDLTVLNIQDVHMNAEAQANISKSLEGLIEQGKVDMIALEGAFKDIDVSGFRSFEDQESVRMVADYFLKENKLSGAIHTALTSPKKIPAFVGVDDKALHTAHIQSYKDSVGKAEGLKKELAREEATLEQKKTQVYNPALLAFDRQVTAYQNGTLSLGDFVKVMSAHSGSITPQVKLFLKALSMEQSMDFKKVEEERGKMVQALINDLSQAQVSQLLNMSLSYRMGKLRNADFYVYLENLCKKAGVECSKYPAMKAYMEYVLLSDQINAEKFLTEVQALEEKTYSSLSKTKIEKDAIRQSRRHYLTGKLLDFALTPEEWKEYSSSLSLSDTSLKSFESFFQHAALRDNALTSNLLAQAKSKKAKFAVLVSGGYHTEGVTQILHKAGIATIALAPKITKIDGAKGTEYLSVFTQEKTPLEKLFDGDRLFVVKPVFLQSLRIQLAGAVLAAWITIQGAVINSKELARKFGMLASMPNTKIEAKLNDDGPRFKITGEASFHVAVTHAEGNSIDAIRITETEERSFAIAAASTLFRRWHKGDSIDYITRFAPKVETILVAASVALAVVFGPNIVFHLIPSLNSPVLAPMVQALGVPLLSFAMISGGLGLGLHRSGVYDQKLNPETPTLRKLLTVNLNFVQVNLPLLVGAMMAGSLIHVVAPWAAGMGYGTGVIGLLGYITGALYIHSGRHAFNRHARFNRAAIGAFDEHLDSRPDIAQKQIKDMRWTIGFLRYYAGEEYAYDGLDDLQTLRELNNLLNFVELYHNDSLQWQTKSNPERASTSRRFADEEWVKVVAEMRTISKKYSQTPLASANDSSESAFKESEDFLKAQSGGVAGNFFYAVTSLLKTWSDTEIEIDSVSTILDDVGMSTLGTSTSKIKKSLPNIETEEKNNKFKENLEILIWCVTLKDSRTNYSRDLGKQNEIIKHLKVYLNAQYGLQVIPQRTARHKEEKTVKAQLSEKSFALTQKYQHWHEGSSSINYRMNVKLVARTPEGGQTMYFLDVEGNPPYSVGQSEDNVKASVSLGINLKSAQLVFDRISQTHFDGKYFNLPDRESEFVKFSESLAQIIFTNDDDMYVTLNQFNGVDLFLGHGSKSQFGDLESALKEIDLLADENDRIYGKGQWVAVFGGDGFKEERKDIAHILKHLKVNRGVPILAIQSDKVEKEWGGVDKYIDFVRYVTTDYELDGKTVIWGGVRDGVPLGPTATYLGNRFISILKRVVAIGSGPIGLTEVQYAYNQGVPITYIQAITKYPEVNGMFGSLDDWAHSISGSKPGTSIISFSKSSNPSRPTATDRPGSPFTGGDISKNINLSDRDKILARSKRLGDVKGVEIAADILNLMAWGLGVGYQVNDIATAEERFNSVHSLLLEFLNSDQAPNDEAIKWWANEVAFTVDGKEQHQQIKKILINTVEFLAACQFKSFSEQGDPSAVQGPEAYLLGTGLSKSRGLATERIIHLVSDFYDQRSKIGSRLGQIGFHEAVEAVTPRGATPEEAQKNHRAIIDQIQALIFSVNAIKGCERDIRSYINGKVSARARQGQSPAPVTVVPALRPVAPVNAERPSTVRAAEQPWFLATNPILKSDKVSKIPKEDLAGINISLPVISDYGNESLRVHVVNNSLEVYGGPAGFKSYHNGRVFIGYNVSHSGEDVMVNGTRLGKGMSYQLRMQDTPFNDAIYAIALDDEGLSLLKKGNQISINIVWDAKTIRPGSLASDATQVKVWKLLQSASLGLFGVLSAIPSQRKFMNWLFDAVSGLVSPIVEFWELTEIAEYELGFESEGLQADFSRREGFLMSHRAYREGSEETKRRMRIGMNNILWWTKLALSNMGNASLPKTAPNSAPQASTTPILQHSVGTAKISTLYALTLPLVQLNFIFIAPLFIVNAGRHLIFNATEILLSAIVPGRSVGTLSKDGSHIKSMGDGQVAKDDLNLVRELRRAVITGKTRDINREKIAAMREAYRKVRKAMGESMATAEAWLDGLGFDRYEVANNRFIFEDRVKLDEFLTQLEKSEIESAKNDLDMVRELRREITMGRANLISKEKLDAMSQAWKRVRQKMGNSLVNAELWLQNLGFNQYEVANNRFLYEERNKLEVFFEQTDSRKDLEVVRGLRREITKIAMGKASQIPTDEVPAMRAAYNRVRQKMGESLATAEAWFQSLGFDQYEVANYRYLFEDRGKFDEFFSRFDSKNDLILAYKLRRAILTGKEGTLGKDDIDAMMEAYRRVRTAMGTTMASAEAWLDTLGFDQYEVANNRFIFEDRARLDKFFTLWESKNDLDMIRELRREITMGRANKISKEKLDAMRQAWKSVRQKMGDSIATAEVWLQSLGFDQYEVANYRYLFEERGKLDSFFVQRTDNLKNNVAEVAARMIGLNPAQVERAGRALPVEIAGIILAALFAFDTVTMGMFLILFRIVHDLMEMTLGRDVTPKQSLVAMANLAPYLLLTLPFVQADMVSTVLAAALAAINHLRYDNFPGLFGARTRKLSPKARQTAAEYVGAVRQILQAQDGTNLSALSRGFISVQAIVPHSKPFNPIFDRFTLTDEEKNDLPAAISARLMFEFNMPEDMAKQFAQEAVNGTLNLVSLKAALAVNTKGAGSNFASFVMPHTMSVELFKKTELFELAAVDGKQSLLVVFSDRELQGMPTKTANGRPILMIVVPELNEEKGENAIRQKLEELARKGNLENPKFIVPASLGNWASGFIFTWKDSEALKRFDLMTTDEKGRFALFSIPILQIGNSTLELLKAVAIIARSA